VDSPKGKRRSADKNRQYDQNVISEVVFDDHGLDALGDFQEEYLGIGEDDEDEDVPDDQSISAQVAAEISRRLDLAFPELKEEKS